eukprot:3726312-Lingulodinium_polyedra.AAC.1
MLWRCEPCAVTRGAARTWPRCSTTGGRSWRTSGRPLPRSRGRAAPKPRWDACGSVKYWRR